MSEEKRKGLFWLIVLRLVVVSALLLAAIIIQSSTAYFLPVDMFYFLTVAVFLLTVFYLLFYYWGRFLQGQAVLQVILDLVIITALVYISGGISGPLYVLYAFVILGSSLVLSSRGIYLTAAGSGILFSLLVELLYYRILPPFRAGQDASLSFGFVLYSIVVAWGLFLALAFAINVMLNNLRLTRGQLDKARRDLQAQEYQAMAGRIFSQVAHEVRNPLAAVAGAVQILKKEQACGPEHQELMEIIIRESDRIAQSLDQFLDLVTPPRKDYVDIDLAEILRETVLILKQSGKMNGLVELQGNYATAAMPFTGHPNQFKQLYWNLITNAVKAMPAGGRLRMEFGRPKKNRISLVFADTGIGMSEETRAKVGEPFFSAFEDGRGLGMSVVRRIVDDYAGTMSLASQLGKGTEITITFPVPARAATAAGQGVTPSRNG